MTWIDSMKEAALMTAFGLLVFATILLLGMTAVWWIFSVASLIQKVAVAIAWVTGFFIVVTIFIEKA